MLDDLAPVGLHYDLFPMMSNGSGDFLCARLGADGSITEFAFFEHDDVRRCFPYGKTLSEAVIVYAALQDDSDECTRFAQLLTSHAEADLELSSLGWDMHTQASLRATLRRCNIGRAVVSQPVSPHQYARRAIRDSRVTAGLKPFDAKAYWYALFDLPADARQRLVDMGALVEPDFDDLSARALEVTTTRVDIGWAWTVLADVAGKNDRWGDARLCVERAAQCCCHTFGSYDQVELSGVVQHVKFDVGELSEIFLANDSVRSQAYWSKRASSAEAKQDWTLAWEAWSKRVLHIPSSRLSVESQLDALYLVADAGGFTCWKKILGRRLAQEGTQV